MISKSLFHLLFFVLNIVIIAIISSCAETGSIQKTLPNVKSISFESFVSKNLSEDQNNLSSQEDEIALVFGIINIDNSQIIIDTRMFYLQKENIRRDQTIPIHTQLETDSMSTNYFFIGLCELDETIDLKQNTLTFKKNLLGQHLSETRKIWSLLTMNHTSFNDDLGIVLQPVQHNVGIVSISGEILRDKYFYSFEVTSQ